MTSPETAAAAPKWSLLLLVALFAHQCEEWWGGPGFSVWAADTLGAEISPERFLQINAVGLALFTAAIVAAINLRELAWLSVAVASLLVTNGVLHLALTVAFTTYSPGVVTGVALHLPLGVRFLIVMSRSLPHGVFVGAIISGIVVHALISLIALS